jgi:cyclopropane fatty-acyl-phospholipid synthase-like methyltransferase
MNLAEIYRQFPRSQKYDLQWMMEDQMGPNVVWLAEALMQIMELRPGMRVLDMGCGKAVSSIFLAKEFGVQVWATDLWIEAGENWQRVQKAGMEGQVFPVHAEAHSLPFADGFFDAAVSLDAYHYFGTDDLYLGNYYRKLIRPGGQFGIVVPGLVHELGEEGVPEQLKPYWEWDWCSFHSPQWWQRHWQKTPGVTVEQADLLPDGWQHWLFWEEYSKAHNGRHSEQEATMLRLDGGRTLGFARLAAVNG